MDRNQNSVVASGTAGRDEIDLMKLVINKPDPDSGGKVTLTLVGGNVMLWQTSTKDKDTEVTLTDGKVEYDTTALPKTLWIEARAVSAALMDIVLKAEYKGASDTVKATALWVQKTNRPANQGLNPWRVRQAGENSGFPNNPKPVDDLQDISDLSFTRVVITNNIALDGSFYGFGTFGKKFSPNENEDVKIGGRILWEFEVFPHGVYDLGARFDLTRQREWKLWKIIAGVAVPIATESGKFPWQQNPIKDNELPNDDAIGEGGKQKTPINDHIYNADTPSTAISDPTSAFLILRANFKEWVRAQVNEEEITQPYEQPKGSRASDKYDWYLVYYLKQGPGGKLVVDSTNPSASFPEFRGAGNGTCTVQLLQNAVSEGFTATYNAATLTWTLEGTSGAGVSVPKTSAPPGTEWRLEITDKIVVTIVQGSVPFGNAPNGDPARFQFSVFKTAAPDGKRNEINTGSIQIDTP